MGVYVRWVAVTCSDFSSKFGMLSFLNSHFSSFACDFCVNRNVTYFVAIIIPSQEDRTMVRLGEVDASRHAWYLYETRVDYF